MIPDICLVYAIGMAYSQPGKRRREVYRFVRERLEEGNPPTVREVQHHFGFRSVQTAQEHLEALIREGALQRTGERRARAYRLPDGVAGSDMQGRRSAGRNGDRLSGAGGGVIPLLGRVEAGALDRKSVV